MADLNKELPTYRHLGLARHLAATPGITLEKGRELGSKYRQQHEVRSAKFDRVAKAIKG